MERELTNRCRSELGEAAFQEALEIGRARAAEELDGVSDGDPDPAR